jgi:transcriptional regulator with XRE-family HTH domain
MEHDTSTTPPNRVREHRERLRMSRADLAARSGLSVAAIGHIETGYRALNDRTLTILANAFGVTKGMLLREISPIGVDPRHSDIAETEVERMLLRFWRRLPAERQDLALSYMSQWADDTVRRLAVG